MQRTDEPLIITWPCLPNSNVYSAASAALIISDNSPFRVFYSCLHITITQVIIVATGTAEPHVLIAIGIQWCDSNILLTWVIGAMGKWDKKP